MIPSCRNVGARLGLLFDMFRCLLIQASDCSRVASPVTGEDESLRLSGVHHGAERAGGTWISVICKK
jgi:hypothetical protein